MLWWLVFAVLVFVPLAWRETQRHRQALPERKVPALGGAVVGLSERLHGVDAAIQQVRSVIDLANASTAQACAATALAQHERRGGFGAGASGPGTARFVELLAALATIGPDDLRDLADLGLDPAKIVAALTAQRVPENWRHGVLETLDYWQQGTSNLRARRYG